MPARLHRLGNIYSRIEGLIRKGHIPKSNRPLWFDVYERYPPKYDPSYTRQEPEIPVKTILYAEDALRVKIHKAFRDRLGVVNLNDDNESISQSLLKTCQRYISEGMSEDEALKKLSSFTETMESQKQTNSRVKPVI